MLTQDKIEYLDHNGFEKLLPINYNENSFEFDLSNVRFVKPHGVVAFLLLLIYLKSINKKAAIILPQNDYVLIYLSRVGFFNQVESIVEFKNLPKKKLKIIYKPLSTMQALTKIKEKKDVRVAVDRFSFNMLNELGIEKSIVDETWPLMIEMTENIPQHAYPANIIHPLNEGFVNVQCLPRRKQLYFTVGDLGIGIRKSLNNSRNILFKFQTDSVAIEYIMNYQISSKQQSLRGGGVFVTANKIKDLKGWMMIRSGGGIVIQSPDGNRHSRNDIKFLPGTQISIVLPSSVTLT